MSHQLLKRIEEFRKQRNLPILTLCKMMDVHNVTYHRWKNAGKITGAYSKIVEDFLEKNDRSSSDKASDIAVIGIACYYPGASNVHELWENILARRVQFRRMLDQRLPLSEYYNEDPKSSDKTYLTKAAFLENFHFDWGKLRIPKKTVESTDISHWLALDTALKTFEDAGYRPSEIPLQNTGVIVGNTLTGEQTRSQTMRLRWPYVQKVLNATLGHLGKSIEERSHIASEMEKIYKSAFYPVTEDSLAGGLANTIAGRICNYLNLKGGGYIVDGACSSSLLAVATASDALKMGHMDLVLAGGVDISLDPFELVGFARAGALAKDQMRVYDQKANGFLPGEGCGFVLLKRLKDAINEKNYIYAVIKGWGISSDGHGGIMEPSSSGQSFAIGRAYKDLDYKISDVDFVEGHGTGTTKGDRVELEGISVAIDKTIKKEGMHKRVCGITSFKSIVGHTKAAAGVGGLIKAVLAVNQRILPPTANCTHPNDVFTDKAKNLYPLILGGRLPLDKKARAGISSAGFGGINCHVTVESNDGPKEGLRPKLDERALLVSHQETEVFVFASRTIIHLKKIIQKFKEDLRNISIAEMADLAALLDKKVKGRLPIKAAIVTDSPEHLYEALLLLENEISSFHFVQGTIYGIKPKDAATHIVLSIGAVKSRVGYLYPGQGSQRLNMTRTLVHRYKWARDLFKLSVLPLFEKVYQPTDKYLTREEQQEFERQLSDTRITQPAVVLSSLIWTEFFSKLGIEPQINIGHSLGELTAYYKNGDLNKETLLKFAQFRGGLMAADSRFPGGMASLFCPKDKAEELIARVSGNIFIANINSPNQIIVSGGKKEIEEIKELAQKDNISVYPLNVSNAFHTPFMKDASDKILKTNLLPGPLKEYFSKQVISPVDFVGTIESVSKECDLMVELGPGRVLTDLVKAINKDMLCLPVESTSGNDRDLNIVLAELFVRNVPVKWEELYRNRLIRTFVPASRKKFIENQCEHPLKLDKQVLKNKFVPVLLQVKEEADQLEDIIPGGLPEITGVDNVGELLMALTHEITGFERESISLNLRLLDDLNLDSIKAAELIGKAARTLGIAGQIDPSQLSNNTLGQIRDRLNELVTIAKSGPAKETVNDILKRYQDKPWVRDFVLELRPEEIKTKNVNQLKGLKNIVFLSGKSEESLVKKLTHDFKISKDVKINNSGPIDCLVAILPKVETPWSSSRTLPVYSHDELNRDSLKSMIERLHQITDLATSQRLDKGSLVVFVQFGGGATSIASTLYLERPDLMVRIIDFAPHSDEEKISQMVIDELQTYEPFSAVRYDAQLARHAVYYEHSNPAEYKKRDISWSDKDIVLVTGGAKGITAQCALEFARATKAHMALIGSSPLPTVLARRPGSNRRRINLDSRQPDRREGSHPYHEIIQTLKQFESERLKCSYYSCDVTDEKEVVKTIAEIEKKLGKVTGFIHGAGLNSLKRLKQASVQEAYQETLPKVIGAVNVCQALKDHPLKLIVGITSIIGLTGMEGSGWYGFSNEILNLYLSAFAGGNATKQSLLTKPETVTIAYSIWDEVGMGAKLDSINRLAQKGIGVIPVKEGTRHFRQLIEGDPGAQQVIVAARVAGIGTWRSSELKSNQFRFLEKIEYILPGVELIARSHLNIEDDPYLLDHNWKGSLLFPFVFGFEAMAQAVAYVLGIEKFDHIKARDINLQRSIPVSEESGTTIEIHAQVLEQEKGNEDKQVKVEIYSQDTAYNDPHFSAVFNVIAGSKAAKQSIPPVITSQTKQSLLKKAKNVLDLDIQTDIYGPILFQGKSFQCIEKIHELYYDEKTNKGECLFTTVYNKSAEEFLKKNVKFNKRFLIGDPFFIDSMLQSMQVIVAQDACLPFYIEEIVLYKENYKGKVEIIANTINQKISSDTLIASSCALMTDDFRLIIIDCKLKVLDRSLEKPSANDLINPANRDFRIINDQILKFSQLLNFAPPIVKFQYYSGLKKLNKFARHRVEMPLVRSAVYELLNRQRINLDIKKIRIKWLDSGKPIVMNNSNSIYISLSHSNDLLMCTAGIGEQGCDIEVIERRKVGDWLVILGTKYRAFLERLVSINGDINLSGTALWTAIEAIKKIKNSQPRFEIKNNFEGCVLFKDLDSVDNYIFAFLTKLTKLQYVVCFNIKDLVIEKNLETIEKPSFLKQFGFNENDFGIEVDYSGPQGQYVFSKRYPVTFKTNKLLSRRVYFTNYFEWMGELREYSIYPIMDKLANLLETGGWGLATNSVKLEILGDLRGNDVVIGRVWMEEVLGAKESIFDLCFEWRRKIELNEFERVAFCKQRTCWIKITSHGEGAVDKLPESIKNFMDSMRPKLKEKKSLEKLIEPYKTLSMGEEIATYRNQKRKLIEYIFDTTLENSNLVGNVYFANYAKWIGAIEDLYFYNLIPDFYKGIGTNGEFVCLNCNVDHLTEAMPFDKILLKMYLFRVFQNGLELEFEFFISKGNKIIRKLAVATQRIIWVKREQNRLKGAPMPSKIYEN